MDMYESHNLRKEKFSQMAKEFEKAMSNKSSYYMDSNDYFDLEQWYRWDKRNIDKALMTLDYGLSIHPQNQEMLFEKADIYLETGHIDKGLKIARMIEEEEGFSDKVKYLNGKAFVNNGFFENGKETLDSIKDKNKLSVITNVVYLYIDNKQWDEAYRWLQLGYENFSDHEEYNAVTAEFYFNRGNFQEAIGYCNKAIDQNPYNGPYWNLLANCYLEDEQYDKCIEACDYAIVCDKDYASSYATKGYCYAMLGNSKEAHRNYMIAENYGITPKGFSDTIIGIQDMSSGDLDESIENLEALYKKYDERSPNIKSVVGANLAYCYYRKGQKEKAFAILERELNENYSCVEIHMTYARIYAQEDDEESCLQAWGEALAISPEPEIWLEIGITYVNMGYLGKARTAFRHILEMRPDFPKIHEKLAVIAAILFEEDEFLEHAKHFKKKLKPEEQNAIVDAIRNKDELPVSELLGRIFTR